MSAIDDLPQNQYTNCVKQAYRTYPKTIITFSFTSIVLKTNDFAPFV